jgi:hypothetical protein
MLDGQIYPNPSFETIQVGNKKKPPGLTESFYDSYFH